MISPENVNPGNFKVIKIIFDNGDFSIAYGIWENKHKAIAMRWNGEADAKDVGYPKAFGNPMWFIVHDDLKNAILKAIIEKDSSLLLQ